ncbi:acyl-CoA dehydrogenase family protein [Nocardioides alcanivorans]|uniref:acyl-CoA dehydrogenase family protein n=1 Tax=Nocardioides alcanivorans TaxID=2897352 RepID=UPI001F2A1E96|nr:acyl-CoA dehydrogenase family protein [Nocardioides alcanivorans]
MDFTHDEEQQALREAVRGLVSKRYSDYENRRRTVADDPGYDRDLWQKLAEMGVLGLPFAEDDGGVGAGPIEVGIVAEELGRVLAPEPFLAAVVLAGGLVADVGTPEQRSELIAPLAAGDSLLAFAHAEAGSRWAATASAVTATAAGDGWVLSGS